MKHNNLPTVVWVNITDIMVNEARENEYLLHVFAYIKFTKDETNLCIPSQEVTAFKKGVGKSSDLDLGERRPEGCW